MKTIRLYIALLPLLALSAVACDGSVYYESQESVDEHGWLPTDSVTFDVDVDDTVSLFNMLVEVRNNINYPYSNAFLFIDTRFPDGSVAHDTLECPLAFADGQWRGKRIGLYVDRRYRLRGDAGMSFPMSGRYHFAIANGMRDSAIAGLKDIGLRIEYAETR